MTYILLHLLLLQCAGAQLMTVLYKLGLMENFALHFLLHTSELVAGRLSVHDRQHRVRVFSAMSIYRALPVLGAIANRAGMPLLGISAIRLGAALLSRGLRR